MAILPVPGAARFAVREVVEEGYISEVVFLYCYSEIPVLLCSHHFIYLPMRIYTY